MKRSDSIEKYSECDKTEFFEFKSKNHNKIDELVDVFINEIGIEFDFKPRRGKYMLWCTKTTFRITGECGKTKKMLSFSTNNVKSNLKEGRNYAFDTIDELKKHLKDMYTV